MGQLDNFRKILFARGSLGIHSSSWIGDGIPVRTNILHRNGWNPTTNYGGAHNSLIRVPGNDLSDFWDIIDELEGYRYLDFTTNILLLLGTDIKNLIDDERPICVIKNLDKYKQERVDRILDRHNVRNTVKESIDDIMYYGSISYVSKLEKRRGKKQLVLYDLEHPYSAIKREVRGKLSYVMPGANDMEIDEKNILYMGSGDFKLKAPAPDYVPLITAQAVEDGNDRFLSAGNTLQLKASEAIYHASLPLFYSITQKIKLYNIKDLLSTILSLRDAIQPVILTLNEEITRNGGDTSQFQNAAQNLESLINRLSDTSISIAELLEIDTLVNAVFSNIKVLPDPGGTLQGLNNLNLEEFKDKLQRLKDGIDDLKKEILESIGIPSDLWEGSSNSNEVYQKNERLQNVVASRLHTVKIATRHFIWTILNRVAPELEIDEQDIILKMFRKSQVEYSRDQREISSLKDGLQTLSETLNAASEVIESNRFTNKEKYYNYLYDSLSNIAPDYGDLIIPPGDVRLKVENELDDDKFA